LLHITFFAVLFFNLSAIQAQEKKYTVVLDAGHGGSDPGAIGSSSREKNINLAVTLELGRLIEKGHSDVKVVYTRKNDSFITLDERANIANRNNADLFISIHANAVKNGPSVRGTETFTLGLARTEENLAVAMRENSAILLEDNYMQTYEGFDPNSSESYIIFEFMQNRYMEQSISLASYIQKAFVGEKRVDRGVKQAGLLVLRKTSMPSVLVELGFISNREEERYMVSEAGKNKLANAIYSAFNKYKEDYDRKQGGSTAAAIETRPVRTPTVTSQSDEIIYKIQILTSKKELPKNSRELKGYKDVSFFQEKGLYKYTYGETSDYNEIRTLRTKTAKDFKGAFIIKFKDGKKVE